MPSRSWRRRGACLLFGLFAMFLGEGLALATCPMHEGTSVASTHAAHPASHGAPSSEHRGVPDACHCLGACLGGLTVTLATPEPAVSFPAVPAPEVAPRREVVLRTHAGQTRLPWATAPPVAA